jgi:hypothetical protein
VQKALKTEDRRPERAEIDPAVVIDKIGACGSEVDYETRTVTVLRTEYLQAVAQYLGLEISPDAVGFHAHGWLWRV